MAYEQIKSLMGKDGQPLPPWQKLVSGSLAGFIAQTTIYPMEVLKTRLALRQTGQYSSVFDCISKVHKHGGMKAFYRGYLVNSVGILPAAGVDLALYETLKTKYQEMYPNNKHPSAMTVLVFANISATAAMFCSYPLFLIRTRLQSSNNKSDSLTSIAANIWRKEGFIGFFRGCIPNLAKVAPAASIGYITYENASRYLGLKR
jgi:solute carrier family 25 phosphate transporter 23/24/25/41